MVKFVYMIYRLNASCFGVGRVIGLPMTVRALRSRQATSAWQARLTPFPKAVGAPGREARRLALVNIFQKLATGSARAMGDRERGFAGLAARNGINGSTTRKWRRKPFESFKTDSQTAPPFRTAQATRASSRKREWQAVRPAQRNANGPFSDETPNRARMPSSRRRVGVPSTRVAR
jgi:hypothetical protein